jgi:hypothetical protein
MSKKKKKQKLIVEKISLSVLLCLLTAQISLEKRNENQERVEYVGNLVIIEWRELF